MSKMAKGLEPSVTHELRPRRTNCLQCGKHMRADYTNCRTITTLAGVARLDLTIRRCRNAACVAHKKPYRPEAEGRFALPHHEFGLDVIARVGRLRYAEHRSVPEIRTAPSGTLFDLGSYAGRDSLARRRVTSAWITS